MKNFVASAAAFSLVFSPIAVQAKSLQASPVAVEGETSIRYVQGTPTIELQRNHGSIQITPLTHDRKRLSFGIAVFNGAEQTSNFGLESIKVSFADGTPIKVFTKDELAKQEKNRAMWAAIAVAAATGLAAAAATNAGRRTYNSTTYAPGGRIYRTHATYENHAESALATAAVVGAGGYAVNEIRKSLDDRIANLGDEIVQTNTLDPGTSYGGRIVLDRIKPKKFPQTVTIAVDWNGEVYPFTFTVDKK